MRYQPRWENLNSSSASSGRRLLAGTPIVCPIPDVSRYDSVSLNLSVGEDPARRWRRDLVGNPGVVVTLDLTSFNYKKLEGSHQETLPLAADGGASRRDAWRSDGAAGQRHPGLHPPGR